MERGPLQRCRCRCQSRCHAKYCGILKQQKNNNNNKNNGQQCKQKVPKTYSYAKQGKGEGKCKGNGKGSENKANELAKNKRSPPTCPRGPFSLRWAALKCKCQQMPITSRYLVQHFSGIHILNLDYSEYSEAGMGRGGVAASANCIESRTSPPK